MALDWVGARLHRAAICALFGGEFFLGRYAGNYYAKELIPKQRRHLVELSSLGIEPSRVCLHCWHVFRKAHLEDETHVLFHCPAYATQRRGFLSEVSAECASKISTNDPDHTAINVVLSSQIAVDWQALGRFLSRVRQIRRRRRLELQRIAERYKTLHFDNIRRQWKREGRYVCRHGVFFTVPPVGECPCLSPQHEADWALAVLMPVLHDELKCIVADTFDPHQYQRLGVLQAEMRRRNW